MKKQNFGVTCLDALFVKPYWSHPSMKKVDPHFAPWMHQNAVHDLSRHGFCRIRIGPN
jgi:hypothetical protein